MLAATDPVAAFLEAHGAGRPVALRTSGTTGAARSVVRTTASWVSSFPHISSILGMDPRSRVWLPGPVTSTMNLFAAVHARFTGAEIVSSPTDATHAHLTPAMLGRALHDDLPLAGVHVVVAGDRLPVSVHDRAVAAGIQVSHYYGSAELSFVAWGSHEGDLRPFPEVEVVLCDGILWARSPHICEGYDGAGGPLERDGDGFATVGDRGLLVDGLVRVAGRGTDSVTTSGATVHVADVEQALRPVVTGDLVVVGVPHPELGEVVVAVLTDASSLPAARVEARRALAASHQPRRWFHVADLPLTPGHKVDRVALARLLASPTGDVRRLP